MSILLQQKHVRKRLNWKKFFVFLSCCILFILIMGGAGLFTVWWNATHGSSGGTVVSGEDRLPPKIKERVNVLALGVDAGIIEGTSTRVRGRTDTMIVLSFDPETREGGLLSIPRDTRTDIPGKGINKINAAHAFGGPQLAVKTVENLLEIPIHYYVKVNLEGFEQIIDALGGIEIDVEKDMYYPDPTQDLLIDLQKGAQTLNGAKALDYVRYRDVTEGDIGRIPRQQKFLRALADKFLQLSSIIKLPELVGIISKNVETDMNVIQILQYAEQARKMDLDNIEAVTLAGKDRYLDDISYWLADEKGIQEQVNRVLKGIKTEENRDIKVRVLNGTGNSGDAGRIATILRTYGFNVIVVENAEHFNYEESIIIAHGTGIDQARKVARALEIYRISRDHMNSIIAGENDDADVTVIVGNIARG